MNLHVVPDSSFINKFCDNLQEAGILENNKIVVRSQHSALKYVKRPLPIARLYSPSFNALVGDTKSYDKVFIHQFNPLLYRWVARHDFKSLNWMVWGADLYNLRGIDIELHEHLTLMNYVRKHFSIKDVLYQAKVLLLCEAFRKAAYAKVDNVLTWMRSEYDFAMQHLPDLKASHQFFFYENQMSYDVLDSIASEHSAIKKSDLPTYILGNSALSELNHLDAVHEMNRRGLNANLVVPISYGDQKYARFLTRSLRVYKGGNIRFIDTYLDFHSYLRLLHEADGIIMNNIRPQGYGNIFMMMYLGKKVFLNEKNISTSDLDRTGLSWRSIQGMTTEDSVDWSQNKSAVSALLGHEKIIGLYRELFS